jgi:hypothetical protein
VEKGGFDLAILDVNLKGENVWPVATRCARTGVPFVIASGGHVDPPPPSSRRAGDREALHGRPRHPGDRRGARALAPALLKYAVLALVLFAAVAWLMFDFQTQAIFPPTPSQPRARCRPGPSG